jgi:hypothetical protein
MNLFESLFGFIGCPRCASRGCGAPGFVEVMLDGPAGPVSARLCVACFVDKVPECLDTMEGVQKEAEGISQEAPEPPAGLLG